MNRNDLVTISASTFYEGMRIDAAIYYKYRNSLVLLCKDVVLDPPLIKRLRQSAGPEQILYVNKGDYQPLMSLSEEFLKFEQLQAAQNPAPRRRVIVREEPVVEVEAPEHLTDLEMRIKLADEYKEVTANTTSLLDGVAQSGTIATEASDELTRSISQRLEMTDSSTLVQCITTMRSADTYLYSHSTNVSVLNGLIGRWLNLSDEDVSALIHIGLWHDLGKLKMPPEILNKPGKLTPEERLLMQSHPVLSEEILKKSGITDENILAGVRFHHERMNGQGYPDRLKGSEIPLFARITAVSDVYDAMVAQRPYQDRQSPFFTLQVFATDRFSDLDIEIVNAFLENISNELLGRTVILSDGRRGKVSYINQNNFAYPLVKVGNKMVATNEQLYCVEMESLMSMMG